MSCTKEYVAILTQTGANAPTARVLENSFNEPIVWTRDSNGIYRGTLEAAFIKKKTLCLVSASSNEDALTGAALICTSEDTIMLLVGDEENVNTINVLIRLYP